MFSLPSRANLLLWKRKSKLCCQNTKRRRWRRRGSILHLWAQAITRPPIVMGKWLRTRSVSFFLILLDSSHLPAPSLTFLQPICFILFFSVPSSVLNFFFFPSLSQRLRNLWWQPIRDANIPTEGDRAILANMLAWNEGWHTEPGCCIDSAVGSW